MLRLKLPFKFRKRRKNLDFGKLMVDIAKYRRRGKKWF